MKTIKIIALTNTTAAPVGNSNANESVIPMKNAIAEMTENICCEFHFDRLSTYLHRLFFISKFFLFFKF